MASGIITNDTREPEAEEIWRRRDKGATQRGFQYLHTPAVVIFQSLLPAHAVLHNLPPTTRIPAAARVT